MNVIRYYIVFFLLIKHDSLLLAQSYKFHMYETSGGNYVITIDIFKKSISVEIGNRIEFSYDFKKYKLDKEKEIIGFSFINNEDVIMKPDHLKQYFLLRKDAMFFSNKLSNKEYLMRPLKQEEYNNTFSNLINELNNNDEQEITINAEFPGGMAALFEFLASNIKYPTYAYKNKIEGKVVCTFDVDEYGNISNITVIKRLDPDCDAEAVRALSKMPRWKPATKNGIPCKSKFSCPIVFRL